jgi:hypothetical protein
MSKSANLAPPDPAAKGKTLFASLPSFYALWFITGGVIVSALWLTLFVAGLLVDSSYYRAAVNYGFADINDWVWVILTFTISNVVILAFLSGLLGGIVSKFRSTEGFTLDKADLTHKIKSKEITRNQIENPFISGFRGIFVFVAILFMQYVSSFSDLGSIGTNSAEIKAGTDANYEQVYSKMTSLMKDTASLADLDSVWKNQISALDKKESDSALVSQIFLMNDSLKSLKVFKQGILSEKSNTMNKTDSSDIQIADYKISTLKNKINSFRRAVKVPANADFSGIGISSFSYFKFAVIVSFLAFIFGYEPSRFSEFMGRILKSDKDKKD